MRRLFPLFFMLCTLATVPALGEPTPSELKIARRLFAEAEADETAGRFDAAASKLEKVLAIKETAGVRFHLGHAEERQGKLLRALANFRRAAELADSIANKEERDDLRRRAALDITELEQRIPVIKLVVPPGNAEILLDGKAVDQTVPARVDPGEHRVTATSAGRTFQEDVIAIERGAYTVTIKFGEPAKANPPASSSVPPSSPTVPPTHDRKAAGVPTSVYVAGGISVALAITSVVFYQRKGRLQGETDDVCRTNAYCDPRRQDVVDRYGAIALATGAGAVVGAGVTAVLYATRDKSSAQWVVTPTVGGMVARGTF